MTASGKKFLLRRYPGRFERLFSGKGDTNAPPTEPWRRERMHRAAETFLMMQQSGAEIYIDRKPSMFTAGVLPIAPYFPCYYGSREIKDYGPYFQKTRNSRSMGVLILPDDFYVVYHSGSSQIRWFRNAEKRLVRALVDYFHRAGLYLDSTEEKAKAIMFSENMEDFARFLDNSERSGLFPRNGGDFAEMLWIPNSEEGEAVLKLVTDPEVRDLLEDAIKMMFSPLPDREIPMEADALGSAGEPVLFAYDFDAARLSRYLTALKVDGYHGIVVCFDFQRKVMERFCGGLATVRALDLQLIREKLQL